MWGSKLTLFVALFVICNAEAEDLSTANADVEKAKDAIPVSLLPIPKQNAKEVYQNVYDFPLYPSVSPILLEVNPYIKSIHFSKPEKQSKHHIIEPTYKNEKIYGPLKEPTIENVETKVKTKRTRNTELRKLSFLGRDHEVVCVSKESKIYCVGDME